MEKLCEHSTVVDIAKAVICAGECAKRAMGHRAKLYTPTKSQKEAHIILGPRVLGIKDAMEYFGCIFSEEQLDDLAHIQFSKDMLRSAEAEKSHILIAMPLLSIVNLCEMLPAKFFKESIKKAWYKNHAFAEQKAGVAGLRWHLISTAPMPCSAGKSIKAQDVMPSPQKEIVLDDAVVLTYAAIGYYQKTGERIFTKWARTGDVLTAQEDTYSFVTFRFGENGIEFGSCNETAPSESIPPIITEIIPMGGSGPFG